MLRTADGFVSRVAMPVVGSDRQTDSCEREEEGGEKRQERPVFNGEARWAKEFVQRSIVSESV